METGEDRKEERRGARAESKRLRAKRRAWREIAKNDMDWDYQYIFILLRFKIGNMVEFFEGSGVYQDKECPESSYHATLSSLRTCLRLLDRIVADDYGPDAAIDAEYHRYDDPSEGFRNNAPDAVAKAWLASARRADRRKESDIRRLFAVMAKNILLWWD
jgi:hypothetical protein